MAKKLQSQQISDIANGLIDPILAKRAGINTMLLGIWDEIVGQEFADCTRPEKITWPRQKSKHGESEDGAGLTPGQLTIACEGARALFLSHQKSEIIARTNAYFGFPAINRITIVQKNVNKRQAPRKMAKPMSLKEKQKLTGMLDKFEDDKLKIAFEKLGKAVLSHKKQQS